jgi:hypothetical protein
MNHGACPCLNQYSHFFALNFFAIPERGMVCFASPTIEWHTDP